MIQGLIEFHSREVILLTPLRVNDSQRGFQCRCEARVEQCPENAETTGRQSFSSPENPEMPSFLLLTHLLT